MQTVKNLNFFPRKLEKEKQFMPSKQFKSKERKGKEKLKQK